MRYPDLARSGARAGLELLAESPGEPPGESPGESGGPAATTGLDECCQASFPRAEHRADAPDPTLTHRRDGVLAVRMGLDSVRGIGAEVAERIVAAREQASFTGVPDLSRRADLTSAQLEALATAGAFAGLGLDRRQALWNAGFSEGSEHVAGSTPTAAPPTLPGMGEVEETLADLWATGVSTQRHPVEHLREQLRAAGILAVGELARVEHGRRVHVGGLITHRQRPGTAAGVTFLNLEDETGMLNVVCSVGVMRVHRQAARNRVAVVVRGILERKDGTINLVADRVSSLETVAPGAAQALQERQSSRDFR